MAAEIEYSKDYSRTPSSAGKKGKPGCRLLGQMMKKGIGLQKRWLEKLLSQARAPRIPNDFVPGRQPEVSFDEARPGCSSSSNGYLEDSPPSYRGKTIEKKRRDSIASLTAAGKYGTNTYGDEGTTYYSHIKCCSSHQWLFGVKRGQSLDYFAGPLKIHYWLAAAGNDISSFRSWTLTFRIGNWLW